MKRWLSLMMLMCAGAIASHAIVLVACKGANTANGIEATQAATDYGACTLKVKAMDGGTFKDWQKCACEVDALHHVDSGACP